MGSDRKHPEVFTHYESSCYCSVCCPPLQQHPGPHTSPPLAQTILVLLSARAGLMTAVFLYWIQDAIVMPSVTGLVAQTVVQIISPTVKDCLLALSLLGL